MTFEAFKTWLNELDYSTITATPFEFRANDFEEEIDFVKSMFLSGERFVNEEDIVVRYSKPYNEDKTDVIVRFEIFKSKAKMFLNYIKKNDTFICCDLTSNKEIKEFVKFFNSLGVKGEGMENLFSKETDYAASMREELEEYKKANPDDTDVCVSTTITFDKDKETETEYVGLYYHIGHNDHVVGTDFNNVKTSVKKDILKIEG